MSIRLPQRISDAPVGPEASNLDGSTLRPVEKPAAAEYIRVATSSSVMAATAKEIATRLEILVVLRTFPGRGQPVRFEFRLRDITCRAAFRRTRGVFLFLIGREQQHDHGAIRVLQDLPGRFQAVDARQVDVHQHQVGVQLLTGRDGGLAGLRLADHVEAVRGFHHRARRFAKRRLVVDDQYSYGHLSIYRMPACLGRRNSASTTREGRPTRPAGPRVNPYSVAVTIRLVLAEDNYLVREGIRQLIETQPDLELAAVCNDFDSLLAAVETHHPDVVVTDIRMPPTGTDEGVRAAEQLRQQHPQTGVVILSQYSDPDYALALLEKGATGRAYLLKERVSDIEQLANAIREVANGGSVIDPKVVEGLVAAKVRKPQSPLAELTPREHEVLGLMAEGKNNAAIAARLFLTERAVEKHINSIFSKLGLSEEKDTHRRVRAALLFLSEEQHR